MNKKLLTAAVGSTLALAGGAAYADFSANYDTMLIPYVVKDANRTTVVTIMSTDDSRNKVNQDLHLQYWTKSTTDANTAACQPSSVFMPVTPNDVVTFDTAGLLGYPLFGDTTNPAPLGVAISYAAPRHGYLIVDDNSGQMAAGFWLELDLANGGAHGDNGAGNFNHTGDYYGQPIAFALMLDALNLPLSSDLGEAAAPVNFWPSSVATTVFTVTPLGSAMRDKENNQVTVQVFNSNAVQGAYDRNENGVDGTVPVTVRCVGRVTPAQLMPGVVSNTAWAAQGGWGYLANLGDNSTNGSSNDLDAVIYQVDSATAAGKFVSNATRIVSQPGRR